jgi:peptidoglycan hydrolase-like protein with peptidoglycan-binding domain
MKSKLDVVKAANPILEIQFNLRDISQMHPDIPKVFPTGRFDPETQEAVSAFQKNFNLPVTGKVDFATWNAISKEHQKCMHCIKPPQSVYCYPGNMYEYKKGADGNLIYILQIILKNYHQRYKNYPDVRLTGVFDEQTEEAVKQFQKFSHLPVTGALDRETWNLLNKINNTCKLYE